MSKHQLSNGFVYYNSCLPLFLQLLLVYIQATCLLTEFFVIHAGLYLYGRTSCIAIATWSHENYQIFIYATIVSKKKSNINITGPCMTYQQKKHTKQGNKKCRIKYKARNTTHWHRYYCVFKTQRRI